MSYQYNAIADHVKNFRPQCLVLCDSPQEQSDLLYLVSHVTKNNGLMICGQVKNENSISKQQADYEKSNAWLSQNKIKAFHTISTGTSKLVAISTIIFLIQEFFYGSNALCVTVVMLVADQKNNIIEFRTKMTTVS